MFDELVFPKNYFKLLEIKQLTNEELTKLRIVSSGSSTLETINRLMYSFLLKNMENNYQSRLRKTKKKEFDVNDYVYKKDGIVIVKVL